MATKKTSETNQTAKRVITIKPPNFGRATFEIGGPVLVIHRFSAKLKNEMRQKMELGKVSSSRKDREPKDSNVTYNEARYISHQGWDGFQASSIRNAVISACRLVNFKMVLAKLSIFVEADGYDQFEPQIPLIRIYGDPIRQDDMARVDNGNPYVAIRPAYHNWKAKPTLRWDADQFSLDDVTNLMARVGLQVGLGEGRNDSKNSAGMGWGSFEIERAGNLQEALKKAEVATA